MEHDEVVSLLQVISVYDSRKLDVATISAWKESARRARWTTEAALDAVHEHFAHSTEYLRPGHITNRIRAPKRQPSPAADVLALNVAPPASKSHRADIMARIRSFADRKAVRD
ncbi:hypothetical protein [Rhodococcus sp. JT-3]|uniref:hypothetical protein n=1 Tax=Rhodococcus sp. JT-3 TaxID=1973213 RepID=UPI0013038F8E|nr:hypothetical protein [Rhodococcus sp. JT-3]